MFGPPSHNAHHPFITSFVLSAEIFENGQAKAQSRYCNQDDSRYRYLSFLITATARVVTAVVIVVVIVGIIIGIVGIVGIVGTVGIIGIIGIIGYVIVGRRIVGS